MKHLTYDERLQIQKALTLKCSFIEIASKVGKDRTTISREVRAYAKYVGKPARSKCKFKCIFEDQMKCPAPGCTKRVCSIACSRCAQYCDRYEPQTCKKLTRAPYVCNGCDDRGHCSLMKKMYEADYAQLQYKNTLRDSRVGISLTDEEMSFIEKNIIPLIKNGISIPVCYDAFADSMPVSIRTLYSYIDRGFFDVNNIDLRRKVQRKAHRTKSGPILHVDKKCHVGRTYADFLDFTEKNPYVNVCEMDTVEGRKGGKVLLTIFFRNCDLQLMYIRDTNTSASVTEVFNSIRTVLDDDFAKVFPLLLSDRGTEFTNPSAVEINTVTGEIQCRLFYCDPQQTNQKSRCERNHEYIRYILPKGTSFDQLTQKDVDLVMNHVNSMPRGSLNAKAPVQLFIELYGEETATRLGLEYIPLDQLCLKPELLKK